LVALVLADINVSISMGSAVIIGDYGSCVVLIVNGFDDLGMVATFWIVIIGCFGLADIN
jgi:hypothetical protein